MKQITLQEADALGFKRFNYAIYRVTLQMLYSKHKSFAVFVEDKAVHFANPESDYFESVLAERRNGFVGIFNWHSDVEEIIAGLKKHFKEEVELPESHLYI